jgi:predicted phosphodiesterase
MLWRALTTVLFAVNIAEDATRHHRAPPILNVAPIIAPLRAAGQCRRFDVVIVDVENVRGRSGFAWNHDDLLEALRIWNQEACLFGKLLLCIDHGHEANSYWLPDRGYAIVFAGPHCKADDTIALELVPFFSANNASNILLVTADYELMQRSKRAGTSKLQILAPDALLSDLDKIREMLPPTKTAAADSESSNAPDVPSGLTNSYELKIGADLLEIEALLKARAAMSSSRRKKLRLKGQALWQKLQTTSPRMLERVVDFLKMGRSCESLAELSRLEQTALLHKWDRERNSLRRKEKTQDRVVLAESLRLKVEEAYGAVNAVQRDTEEELQHAARSYVYKSSHRAPARDAGLDRQYSEIAGTIKTTGVLRLVVVSDTHGFEDQLTQNGEPLPEGDVLLHLGDFADDRGPHEAQALRRFDEWLARQAHPLKIVLRGNHDPRHYQFTQSGATYITQATTRHIAGYKFAFAPFLAGGLRRKKCLPKSCDVLVSHVPPRNILDRCVTGKYAGSQTLLKGAKEMTGGPPILWLCGHIHEGRGVVRNTVLCLNKKTTIVNAASANSGTAARLEYGPTVVQLGEPDREEGNTKQRNRVEVVEMDGQFVYMNDKYPTFFRKKPTQHVDCRQTLLSVDLGLRTGLSLFNDAGELVRYEQFQFESVGELQRRAATLIQEWEENMADGNPGSETWKVTHVAVEGGDPPLADAWRRAVNGQRALLFVKPDEWRTDLLTNAEMQSGESSKTASRLIARQIVSDYGVSLQNDCNDESFQSDVAESILLGLHVARRLGWVKPRDPAIRRAPNGGVLVSPNTSNHSKK